MNNIKQIEVMDAQKVDAFIMAKNIIINDNAYIFSNLFAMAESVEVKGVVYDVYALTNNFNISGGYIYRDAKISCKTLNVNGSIGRNAFVSCSSINFNTDGNDKGTIYGNLTYSAPSEFNFGDKNVVKHQRFHLKNLLEKLLQVIFLI